MQLERIQPSALETAQAFFGLEFDELPAGGLQALSADAVIQTPEGDVYMGHRGFVTWYVDTLRNYERRAFESQGFEQLTRRWVLAVGDTTGVLRSGEVSIQPGCWLVRVEDGLISACLFHRTVGDALSAVD